MKSFLQVMMWLLIIVGIIAAIGWAFLFEVGTIQDNRMAPNILKGDHYLIYLLGSMDTGTVVECSHPKNAGQKVVGRIVASARDRVKIERSSLYLNDRQAETSVEGDYVLVDETIDSSPRTLEMQERIETLGMIRYRILWPKQGNQFSRRRRMREKSMDSDSVFLLADNRAFGEDSRTYGPVKLSSCIGSPLLIYQPGEVSGDAGDEIRWFDFIR